MNYSERLMECDLEEVLGGESPPDLIERALAALESPPAGADHAPESEAHTPALGRKPARIFTLRRLAEAACIVLAVGLVGWLVTRPQPLPEGVTVAGGASYRVGVDYVELRSGWMLLEDGAPELRAGNSRVTDVRGRVVAGRFVPDEASLASLAGQWNLNETEKEMLKQMRNWVAAAGVALCVLSGSALLNNDPVTAQHKPVDPPPIDRGDARDIPDPVQEFKVLRQWSGNDSFIKEKRVEFVTDFRAWHRLWATHTVDPKALERGDRIDIDTPTVNFDKEIVLAVFGGMRPPSSGCEIVEILQGSQGYTIRAGIRLLDVDGDRSDKWMPYGLFVLPRTNYRIDVELDTQTAPDAPRRWKPLDASFTPRTSPSAPLFDWKPTRTMNGEGAGKAGTWFADSPECLAKLWQEMAPAQLIAPPQVDFDTEVVIAASGRGIKGGSGMTWHGAWWGGPGYYVDSYMVRITPFLGGVRIKDGQPDPVTTAWSVWVLPRLPAGYPYIHIEGMRTDKSGEKSTLHWTRTHTFEVMPAGVREMSRRVVKHEFLDVGPDKAEYRLLRSKEDEDRYWSRDGTIEPPLRGEYLGDYDKEDVVIIRLPKRRLNKGFSWRWTPKADHMIFTYAVWADPDHTMEEAFLSVTIRTPKLAETLVIKEHVHEGGEFHLDPDKAKEVARFEP